MILHLSEMRLRPKRSCARSRENGMNASDGTVPNHIDRHKSPLVRFETEMHRGTIMIKVQLDDDLAEQFRKAFRGSYVD
jgi:hypothetical protein